MTLSNKDKRIAIPAEELLERARAISTGDGADYEFAKQGGRSGCIARMCSSGLRAASRNAMNIERINFFPPQYAFCMAESLYGVGTSAKQSTTATVRQHRNLRRLPSEMESAWKVYGSDKTVTEFYPYLSFMGREPLSIEKMASLSDDRTGCREVAPYGYYTKTEHSCRNYERNRAAAKVFKNIDDAIAELGSITFHASKVTFERAGADSAKVPSLRRSCLLSTYHGRRQGAGAYIVKLTRSRIWTSTLLRRPKMFQVKKRY